MVSPSFKQVSGVIIDVAMRLLSKKLLRRSSLVGLGALAQALLDSLT